MSNPTYNEMNSKDNNANQNRSYYKSITPGELSRQVNKLKRKFFCVSTFICACVVAISIVAVNIYSNELKSRFDNEVQTKVTSQVEKEIASIEHFKIVVDKTHVENIRNINLTQLTKTPLLKLKNELAILVECYEKLYDSNSELYEDVYNEILVEYERCNEVLNNKSYKYPYDDRDLALLAKAIMREQGDNRSPDEAQMLVGCVILNRQANGGINGTLKNPTILDVLQEKGQYGHGVTVNYQWNMNTSNVTDRVWENARKVLEREYEAPANVVFQALFPQGTGIYKKFYNEGGGTYTYFCYGNI